MGPAWEVPPCGPRFCEQSKAGPARLQAGAFKGVGACWCQQPCSRVHAGNHASAAWVTAMTQSEDTTPARASGFT
eukprot:5134470-Amphidinium_carterae.1